MNMQMKIVGITGGPAESGLPSTAGEVDLSPHCVPFMNGKECGFMIDLKNIPQNVTKIKLANSMPEGFARPLNEVTASYQGWD
jgi:hypothetical protein